MQPNRMLTVFTAVQLLLGGALIYLIVTGRWEQVTWVVLAGALFTTLFGYWYVDARR